MAKMIPSVISPEIKSVAEKRIFEWFRDDPATDGWIILHSLGISNHNKVVHGEIDFFVLVPYKGLFALEVKGGRVRRNDGIWSFTNKYGQVTTKERGPFDQVWDGVFSIIGDIKSKLDDSHRYLQNVFFGIGVMFPDVKYDTVGCDESQWQVFDCNDGKNVAEYIERLFLGTNQRWEELYGYEVPIKRLPSEEDINYIACLLRGDFDKAVAMSAQIRYSEEELVRLTNEQYRCIDQLDDNKRCIIQGGAGTGKTLIAVEEAKKATASGKKVALFCYNRNLGEWLEKYFEDVPLGLRPHYVGTFHRFMIRTIKQNGMNLQFPENDSEKEAFYADDIPIYARQSILELREKFNKIIVDEAQDLITTRYLDVFDACIHGGLTRGNWTMLGDFSQQAIYNTSMTGDDLKDILEARTSFIRFKLTVNCRNTKAICEEITTVTGFEPPSDIWSKVDGIPVEYMTYSSDDEQKKKLVEIIKSLLKNNISPKKISILSPVKRENSVVSSIDEFEISDYKTYGNNRLSFCTIQAFKGLENSVVILTDIKTVADKKLMYVALSRARSGLYILASVEARSEYIKLQQRRIENGHKA